MTYIDIILGLVIFFFIINIINNLNNNLMDFNENLNCNDYSFFNNKPVYIPPLKIKNNFINNKKSNFDNKGKEIIDDIYDLPNNQLENEIKEIKQNKDKSEIQITNNSNFESRENNRYNRNRIQIPKENDLIQITNYNLNKYIENTNQDEVYNILDELYNKNINDIDNDKNSIDNKLKNKSQHNQKLYKDSKTIRARFNKNSIINSYKSELDYYENLNTPWWSENIN